MHQSLHQLFERSNKSLEMAQASIFVGVLTLQPLDLLVQISTSCVRNARGSVEIRSSVSHVEAPFPFPRRGRRAVGFSVVSELICARAVLVGASVIGALFAVDSPQMLDEVLASREALTGAPLAVLVRTHERCFGPAVLLVHFSLVAQETA